MARHQPFVNLDVLDTKVRHEDVAFIVDHDRRESGELRVNQGAVVWRGRAGKVGRKLLRTRFDALMQQAARRAERRPVRAHVSARKKRGS
jgi:hypothetical protein